MKKIKEKKSEHQIYKELYQCVGLIDIIFFINTIFQIFIFAQC